MLTTGCSRPPTAHECAAVAEDPSAKPALVRKRVAVATALMTMGFPFDDEPTANSQDELAVATSPICPVVRHPPVQHHPGARSATPPHLRRGVIFTSSGAVRMGECNHEMPGLPYPAFREVNAEPGRR